MEKYTCSSILAIGKLHDTGEEEAGVSSSNKQGARSLRKGKKNKNGNKERFKAIRNVRVFRLRKMLNLQNFEQEVYVNFLPGAIPKEGGVITTSVFGPGNDFDLERVLLHL